VPVARVLCAAFEATAVAAEVCVGLMPNIKEGLARALAIALSRGKRRLSGSCAAAGLRSMLVSISVQRVTLPLWTACHHDSGTAVPTPVAAALAPGVVHAALWEAMGARAGGNRGDAAAPACSRHFSAY
jgi:hypothetical protein